MTDGKKKRMSMLDSIATAGAAGAAPSMMTTNRALRSARDAVDAHHVWELDPDQVIDERPADRLDLTDVGDLQASIEANGQTVPILVRRHPTLPDRYLLVYGARRLAAIRDSDRVEKVRALITSIDEDAALVAQVAENTARRDLTYIERALFALSLQESGFGTQNQIAEVLNATKSSVSMAISIARTIGTDLAQAIGPAQGIGRPRWEALAQDIAAHPAARDDLLMVAAKARQKALFGQIDTESEPPDPSVEAFDAVARHLRKASGPALAKTARRQRSRIFIDGRPAGAVEQTARGLRIDLADIDPDFATWLEREASLVVQELHDRWISRSEDDEQKPQ